MTLVARDRRIERLVGGDRLAPRVRRPIAGALVLPSLQLSGSLTPVVSVGGFVEMPSPQVTGNFEPGVALSGSLTLPSLQLSGSFTPGVAVDGALGMPSLLLTGSFTPAVGLGGTLSMPSLQLAGAITPSLSLGGSLGMPSLQLSGSLATLTSPVTAWYRMAASTPVSGEWQTVVDVLGGAALVQNDTDRRLASSTSGNGLLIGTYDGTDVLRMPLSATNFNATKFGAALWLRLPHTGTQYLLSIASTDAGVTSLFWGITTGGVLWVEINVGGNFSGRHYETPASTVAAGVWFFARLQFDASKTAECDTTGSNADAKLRVFVGEVARALTAVSFGGGTPPTSLRTPNLSGGAAIWGAAADADAPAGAVDANGLHGPNTFILLETPTAAQGLALRDFEVPT